MMPITFPSSLSWKIHLTVVSVRLRAFFPSSLSLRLLRSFTSSSSSSSVMDKAAAIHGGGGGGGGAGTASSSSSSRRPFIITTFVQTDTNSFRDIVQRLTGPSTSSEPTPHGALKRPTTSSTTPSLHERRRPHTRQRLEIIVDNPTTTSSSSCFQWRPGSGSVSAPALSSSSPSSPTDPRYHLPSSSATTSNMPSSISNADSALISPSANTPTSMLSRLSLLHGPQTNYCTKEQRHQPSPPPPNPRLDNRQIKEEEEEEEGEEEQEEKAIRERRFYLHPSPRSAAGFTERELLDLFPLTSPKWIAD